MKAVLFLLFLVIITANGQWSQSSLDSNTFSLFSANGHIFASGEILFRSTDNGSNWHAVGSVPSMGSFVSIDSLIFGGVEVGIPWDCEGCVWPGGIYVSTNGGLDWTRINSENITSLAVKKTKLFAGTAGNGVIVSTDFGISWNPTGPGLINGNSRTLVVSGNNLYAGSHFGVFRYNDSSDLWIPLNGGLTNTNISALAVCESVMITGTDGGGVFRSTNNGADWSAANAGFPFHSYIWDFAVWGTTIFAARSDGIYRSTDLGNSWTPVNTGLTHLDVVAIEVNGSYLFASIFGKGIWSRPLSQITSYKPERIIARTTTLSQNYPNPFNPTTVIKYHLPVTSNVTLKIFDVLGREAAALVNEQKQPGSYEVTWNAKHVSSGVYFYRLQAGDFVQTRRLVLQK